MKSTKPLIKTLDKATIRKQAIRMLELRGCNVWVQNNLAVKGRKFIGKKGIADVSGYVKATGIRVECEIKTITDKLSDEQVLFLTELKKAGGVALIASQRLNEVIITEWVNEL